MWPDEKWIYKDQMFNGKEKINWRKNKTNNQNIVPLTQQLNAETEI